MRSDNVVKADRSCPARAYMPWLRWFAMLAAIFAVVFVFNMTTALVFRIGILLTCGALFFTYYPVKQRFVLNDGRATASVRAKANIFGGVSVDVDANGERITSKIGKLGSVSQYFDLALHLGNRNRLFTLIHLSNTRYFILSEKNHAQYALASIDKNTLCF